MNDLPLIAWCAWGALCMIFGMLIMALARVERGDLDEDDEDIFCDENAACDDAQAWYVLSQLDFFDDD